MNNLVIVNAVQECEGVYQVDLKTFIVVALFRLAEPCNLELKVVLTPSKLQGNQLLKLTLDNIKFEVITQPPALSKLCTSPAILLDKYVVSGLCSVARQICKFSSKEDVKNLLGFREACLVSCAETSVWTKFCEIDIIQTINEVLSGGCLAQSVFTLPKDVLRYENHLSQPVRIHNIYKLARNTQKDPSLSSSTPREKLAVCHHYAEGPFVTLADFILLSSFEVMFLYFENFLNLPIENYTPLTYLWFKRVKEKFQTLLKCTLNLSSMKLKSELKVSISEVSNISLYKSDPANENSTKHTKQYKIESALILIEKNKTDINNSIIPVGFKVPFTWQTIPILANPQGGALPASRAARKCEQLENILKAVLQVVGSKKYVIVDFCSGSGHLGILIAIVLPHCEVILVENKEKSLARALKTIKHLALPNITVVQSNLDYFTGDFNLGIALHACGVATDLVLQMCIKNKADFIVCPCCYGGVKNCHKVSYPRSKKFQEVFHGQDEAHYFNLAHAADQTHGEGNAKTQQGYFCMDIVDSDRKCYAEDCGYQVHLGKLQPVTCTNKNNLLVGIYGGEIC